MLPARMCKAKCVIDNWEGNERTPSSYQLLCDIRRLKMGDEEDCKVELMRSLSTEYLPYLLLNFERGREWNLG